jgi:ABC-type amino acid transport substrate-binding protein
MIRTVGGALAALLLALPASAQAPTPTERLQSDTVIVVGQDLDEITARGYVEIGVYEDFPPFSFVDDGQLQGVDVAIAQLIGEALGVEARVRAVASDETVDADLRNWVWRGPVVGGDVVNVMMHVPWNRDLAIRNELVVLTGQYFNERIGIAWRESVYPEKAPTPAYFRTDRVGVENDSLADFYLSSFMGGILAPNVVRHRTTDAAVAALRAGAFDAAMGPLAQLQWGLRGAEGLKAAAPSFVGLSTGQWTVGVAVRHNFRDLGYAVDDAIRAAVEDGRMAEIFAAHGLDWTPPDW